MTKPKPESEKRKRGQPTLYRPEYAAIAKDLFDKGGATNADLSRHFGVAISTICEWKFKYPEFAGAIKRIVIACDDRVEKSLYEKAMGYSYPSEKIVVVKDKVVRVPIVEHVPPSDTAMIFWLKNRRRADWRDRSDVNLQVDTPLAEALDALKKRGKK